MRVTRHFVIFTLLTATDALTYWIDRSCDRYPRVEQAVQEAILMARLADQRLSAMDIDLLAVYQRIFHARDYSDVVREKMRGIGAINPEFLGRQSANIRIYCDQGDRWTLQPDRRPGETPTVFRGSTNEFWRDGYYVPNSLRQQDYQVWVDRTNGMVTLGYPKCYGGRVRSAQTSVFALASYTDETPSRTTITLCRPYVGNAFPTVQSLAEAFGSRTCALKLTDLVLRELLSNTILHELTHAKPFLTTDVEGGPYGWVNIVRMSAEKAMVNADNHAYLGLLAVLDLAGCQLDMDVDPETRKWKAHPEDGKLKAVNYFHSNRGVRVPRTLLERYEYGEYS